MAAANMKAVKLRIKSIQNTMQITKAMELVASSKLRRAKEKADRSKPYFNELREALRSIAEGNSDFSSPYTKESDNEEWCYVVIAGDRGMAGGYNSNLFKFFEAEAKGKVCSVLPIGKKCVDYVRQHKIPIVTDLYNEVADISVSDCFNIAELLCKLYREKKFGHIALCYTNFISMMTQRAGSTSMLPLSDFKFGTEGEEKGGNPDGSQAGSSGDTGGTGASSDSSAQQKARNLILYEPSSEEVFNAIVPEYLAGLLHGSICLSVASELAARRMAMEAASDNAAEMIDKLSLFYNRARQASITQEITEIVGGAEQQSA